MRRPRRAAIATERTARPRAAPALLGLGLAVNLAAAVLAAGCAPALRVTPPTPTGTFRGATASGDELILTFTEHGQAFRGEGTAGAEPVAVAGAVGWRGVGTLVRADGETVGVDLRLSADGETLVMEAGAAAPVVLTRGAPASPPEPGPLSGRYRTTTPGGLDAETTLVQSGALLSGAAVIAGDAAGVSGRMIEPDRAEGVATFLDGSQVRFEAVVAADRRSLTVRGFGRPLRMRRIGGPR